MLDLLLSPKEENEVNNLREKMVISSSVTVALQRNNLDPAAVHLLFDETCKKNPDIDCQHKYLGRNAKNAKSNHFENGIKILKGR